MPGAAYNLIAEIAADQHGYVTQQVRAALECHAAGLGPALIGQAIKDGGRRGVFTAPQVARLRRETGLERTA